MQIKNVISWRGEGGGGGGVVASLNLFLLFVIIFSLPYLAYSLVKVLSNVGAFIKIGKKFT